MSETAAAVANVASSPPSIPRRAVLACAALVSLCAVADYWVRERRFEETDDAQVDGDISSVGPLTSGVVVRVYVVQNQSVRAGDLLAEIDSTDLEIAVEQARAEVAEAEAQLKAEDPSVHITTTSDRSATSSAQSDLTAASAALAAARTDVDQIRAQLAQAEANDKNAQLEKSRSAKLVAVGAVSQSDYDTRANAADATAASAEALRHALASTQSHVEQQEAQLVAFRSHLVEIQANAPRHLVTREAWVGWRQASLEYAKARLAQAQRNLSYTKVVAPVSGVVASKSVTVGDYVSPGGEMFAVAQNESLWVTANYRETQIGEMQPGQPATLHVDSLSVDLQGAVERIGAATGARLSMLPPENASGNYVKVVQRIPVRIKLDPDSPGLDRLRIGMSVEPKVKVR